MRKPFCPRCGSFDIFDTGGGYYSCNSCGYKGMLGIEKEFKKFSF